MQDLTGKDIGRYHIIEKLGQGGMAVVYRAFDTRLERDVALKFIRVELFGAEYLERVLKRFEKEGKALGRFSHGNIVQVHDYGEYEGVPYLVMEYLRGGTLKSLTGKPVEWREAFRLLVPIAHGLAYAHGKGVVHWDIKPSNILINEAGEPKLADFGIARILEGDEGSTLTGTGVGVGTPEYMAPEQGLGREIDGRADVYALGVVLYELITGRKPFTADTPMAVIVKQIHDPLPQPGDFVSGLPKEVDKVLYKALSKDPENRYGSMEGFAGAMEKLLWQPLQSGQGRKVEAESPPEKWPIGEPASIPADPEATRDDLLLGEVKQEKVKPVKSKAGKPSKTLKQPWWGWAGGIGGLAVVVILANFLLGGGDGGGLAFLASETPTLTQTSVPTQTQIPTKTLTPTATSTQTRTPTQTQTPTATLGVGSTRVSEADGMVQVYVPAGAFEMGSEDGYEICRKYRSDCQQSWFEDEEPVHTVYLDAYWINQTEVTNGMFALCVADGACEKPGGSYYSDIAYADHPVVYVSWNDAATYC